MLQKSMYSTIMYTYKIRFSLKTVFSLSSFDQVWKEKKRRALVCLIIKESGKHVSNARAHGMFEKEERS